ncbi:ABC transporter permease subunit [Williamsia sp. CHRR-6]|uniref:ABC transporter permease subunit n=1 Tax=Williamsia sp. CHRR-6 TaxID=2835871 RepID=UPI001BDAA6AA|nr:ABC transporter permease subunit [Williamsia sp. CHRR-6]MBT0567142.1 ABC transporter permease subunit [Williamsia sp. CHRR-6]
MSTSTPTPTPTSEGSPRRALASLTRNPAVFFILRRVVTGFFVLLGATLLMYLLTAWSGDPRQNFESFPPDVRESKIAAVTKILHLDDFVLVRYFRWLGGVSGCVVPGLKCDLGKSLDNTAVTALLGNAITTTLRLVLVALALAVILGVIVGILSALRQYSGFDYTVTFASFLFFSLPIFWVAVLLKEFGAIKFNNWLSSPSIPIWVSVVVGLAVALFLSTVIGGNLKRRAIVFGVSLLAVIAVLQYFSAVNWFARPALGVGLILLLSVLSGLMFTTLISGLAARPVLSSSLITAVVGTVIGVLLAPVLKNPAVSFLFVLALITVAVSFAIGWFVGGEEYRSQSIRAAILTGLFTGGFVLLDRILSNFARFSDKKFGRPIPTVGDSTPNFRGNIWQHFLDTTTSLLLPTIALILISFASYTRYTRASMLEVMNQDYIRTARAKGLTERTVVMRHAFRNALIPLTTVVAYDFAAVLGGAVITENVFGWKGMGTLFITGLKDVNPNVVMAFFLVTATAAVLFNLIADLLYTALDPRIRLQ